MRGITHPLVTGSSSSGHVDEVRSSPYIEGEPVPMFHTVNLPVARANPESKRPFGGDDKNNEEQDRDSMAKRRANTKGDEKKTVQRQSWDCEVGQCHP